ncbi:SPASM domain-containing protein [Flavonifractor plautii]|uniref:4Fe4S-binding SPASM domain-containing protein n=1 Tax=Flavonifractor plautii 1_3_50AFAA TaxID=742738 RepID=A0A096BDH5_FLAPL|nr:SPASM domain-containing protein [Flavonifractor plautii]KGF57071.1 hypothetical protein HMPREF9460_00495 [Flavonifractor plautii 1_3_50AFAA]
MNRLLARHDQLARLGRPVRLKELERLRLLLRTGCRRDCYCNAQTGRSLAVTPDGRLWPCSALAGAEGCLLGTLGAGTALPQSPCPGLEPPEECARCPAFGLCGGGCPAFGLCGGGCPAARRAGPLPPGLPDAPEDAGARLPAGGEIGVVEYVENRVSR